MRPLHQLFERAFAADAGKPDGSAPDYQMMALLTFGSIEDFKTAGKAHGREIFADIANFTNAPASVQINNILN